MFRLAPLLTVLLVVSGVDLAAASPNEGFIYGTVTLQTGTQHTGFLRWEDEEAYWDDLFHSRQINIAWVEFVDMKALHKEEEQEYFQTHGMIDRIAYALNNKNPDDDISRLFIMRFGDIAAIRIDDDENVTVELNDGSRHEVRGYSNDVSTDILVYTGEDEPEQLEWDDLAEIRFAPAPGDAVPYAERLYGRVTSTRGDFEGFIQWDKSECTSIDILDSRQEDVAMGEIKSIRRDPGHDTVVTLKDGQVLNLTGSNDVGGGNRGVVVETAALGRVTIPWKRFKQVDFMAGQGTGRGRESYADNRELAGAVTDKDGRMQTGPLVYDLDAARTHDIFNGTHKDVEYDIPFGLIQIISPQDAGTCRVTLRDGQVLELGDDRDTGRDHSGVLVFTAARDQAQRVPWRHISEIRFAP